MCTPRVFLLPFLQLSECQVAVAHGYSSIVSGLNASRAAAQVIAATVKVGGPTVYAESVLLYITSSETYERRCLGFEFQVLPFLRIKKQSSNMEGVIWQGVKT